MTIFDSFARHAEEMQRRRAKRSPQYPYPCIKNPPSSSSPMPIDTTPIDHHHSPSHQSPLVNCHRRHRFIAHISTPTTSRSTTSSATAPSFSFNGQRPVNSDGNNSRYRSHGTKRERFTPRWGSSATAVRSSLSPHNSSVESPGECSLGSCSGGSVFSARNKRRRFSEEPSPPSSRGAHKLHCSPHRLQYQPRNFSHSNNTSRNGLNHRSIPTRNYRTTVYPPTPPHSARSKRSNSCASLARTDMVARYYRGTAPHVDRVSTPPRYHEGRPVIDLICGTRMWRREDGSPKREYLVKPAGMSYIHLFYMGEEELKCATGDTGRVYQDYLREMGSDASCDDGEASDLASLGSVADWNGGVVVKPGLIHFQARVRGYHARKHMQMQNAHLVAEEVTQSLVPLQFGKKMTKCGIEANIERGGEASVAVVVSDSEEDMLEKEVSALAAATKDLQGAETTEKENFHSAPTNYTEPLFLTKETSIESNYIAKSEDLICRRNLKPLQVNTSLGFQKEPTASVRSIELTDSGRQQLSSICLAILKPLLPLMESLAMIETYSDPDRGVTNWNIVRRKLHCGWYATGKEFRCDMRTIAINVKIISDKGSPMWNTAHSMLEKFEPLWAASFQSPTHANEDLKNKNHLAVITARRERICPSQNKSDYICRKEEATKSFPTMIQETLGIVATIESIIQQKYALENYVINLDRIGGMLASASLKISLSIVTFMPKCSRIINCVFPCLSRPLVTNTNHFILQQLLSGLRPQQHSSWPEQIWGRSFSSLHCRNLPFVLCTNGKFLFEEGGRMISMTRNGQYVISEETNCVHWKADALDLLEGNKFCVEVYKPTFLTQKCQVVFQEYYHGFPQETKNAMSGINNSEIVAKVLLQRLEDLKIRIKKSEWEVIGDKLEVLMIKMDIYYERKGFEVGRIKPRIKVMIALRAAEDDYVDSKKRELLMCEDSVFSKLHDAKFETHETYLFPKVDTHALLKYEGNCPDLFANIDIHDNSLQTEEFKMENQSDSEVQIGKITDRKENSHYLLKRTGEDSGSNQLIFLARIGKHILQEMKENQPVMLAKADKIMLTKVDAHTIQEMSNEILVARKLELKLQKKYSIFVTSRLVTAEDVVQTNGGLQVQVKNMNFCQQKPRNVYKVNSFAEDIFHLDKSKKHVSFKHQGQNEESFFKRKEDWLEGCNKDGGKKLKLVYQKNDFFMERAELMFKAIAKFIMHPNIGQLCKSINQVSANFFYDLKNTIEIILANAKLGGFPENKKNILKFILQRCLTLKILDQKLCDYIKSALIRLDLDSLVACKSAFVRGSLSPHASSNAHGTIPNMEQFSGDSNFPSTKEVHDPAQRRLKLEKKIQIDGINQSCGADMSTNLVSDERRLKNYLKVPRTEIENQTIGNKMMIKRDQAENHQAKRRKRKLKYPIENKHLKSNNVTCLNLDSQGKCRSVVDHLSHAGSVAHITMPNLELPDKAHDPPLRRSKRKKIQRVNLYCGFDLSTNLVQDEKESEGNLQVSRIEMKNEKENATREMMVIRSQAKDLQVKRRKQKLMYPVENQPSKSNSVTHLDHDSQERNGDVSVRAGLPSYKSSNTYLTMPDLKQLSEGCNIPSNEKMHDPALRRSKRKKKQRVDVTAKLTSDGRQLEKNLQASLVEVKNKKQKVSKEMIKKHQAKNLQGKEITQKLNQEVTLKNISSKCQVEINMICKQEEKEWRRNLRQRQTHSDQERLESQKFKEQRKNEFRESQYYNTKENYILTKRVNDLLKVPIKIIKNDRINKNSHLIYSCSDTQCTLCNGHYARVLITDEELESVERNVKDVIPISLDGPKIFVPRIYSRLDRVTVPPNCVIDADKQFLKRYNEGLLTFMG